MEKSMTGYRSKIKMSNDRWDDYDVAHGHTITLSIETADSLFRDILVKEYRDNLGDIAELESKDSLGQWEIRDLIDAIERSKAMEVLIRYYFPQSEYIGIIGNQFDPNEEDKYEIDLLRSMREGKFR
jgi:hypothetical protein